MFFLAKMARFRLRVFRDSKIPRTQSSCMPRTASCMPRHQLLSFQNALMAVEGCLRRFYFLKTGAPFQTKALVAVEGCLRRFYFFKTGSPVIKVRDTREGSQAKYERNVKGSRGNQLLNLGWRQGGGGFNNWRWGLI